MLLSSKVYPSYLSSLDLIIFFPLGSTAKFRSEVTGKPTPKIEWLKNGEVSLYKIKYMNNQV